MLINPRQITLLIAFPIVVVLFIILGILVLRKDIKYWGNRLFALFFWVVALALLFNLTYLFSININFIDIFNLITIETINIGVVFLLLGTLVVYKGEYIVIKNRKILLFLVVIILLIIIHIFLSYQNSVSIEYRPVWSMMFGLYESFFSQGLLISIFYFSLKFYIDLASDMKRKFRWYLIGLIFLDITLLSIIIGNMHLFPALNDIITILNFCIIIGALMIYSGIIRRN